MTRTRLARAGVAAAGAVLGVVAYRILRYDLHQPPLRSVPAVAVGWTAIAAGLVASARRPGNRLGPLMAAYGLAVLVRPWQYSDEPWVFTVGYLLGELNLALFAHVVLAYPTGRLGDRLERRFVQLGYAVALALPLATLLVYDGDAGLHYVIPGGDSRLLVSSNDALARALEQGFVIVAYGALAACFVALVVRRLARATARRRRLLAPLVLAAVLAATRAVVEFLFTYAQPTPEFVADELYWWQVAGQIALPLALLAGLLSERLRAAQVADLVRALDHAPVEEIEGILRRTLGDSTLEVAFWLPELRRYGRADGAPVELPERDPRRAVTLLDDRGEHVAAIVHDPGLQDDPGLVEAVAVAARLALENGRLHAELRAQLARVRESRARIVAAGDEQRRRIERDLHDGAQQRLVALALELRAAGRRHGPALDAEVQAVLEGAVEELQAAVADLRELARGVHPAILTEEGLGPALASLAARCPLAVTVATTPEERLPAEIEAAAYFVACEALANAVKHAGATHVRLSAVREAETLRVEVSDDGAGGADPAGGTGLRGLVDRVEAHGGRLRLDSAAGRGTTVIAELPCVS